MNRYRHCPIKEAAIDIRCVRPDGVSAKELEIISDNIKDQYPKIDKLQPFQIQSKFQLKGDGPVTSKSLKGEINTHIMKTNDGLNVAQFRLNGFTYSRIEPYNSWDTTIAEANKLWVVYSNTIHPVRIERIGIRYINLIAIPSGKVNLVDYFVEPPTITGNIDGDILEFFNRSVISIPRVGAKAIITMTTPTPPREAGTIDVVLDIDVFIEEAYDKNQDKIWKTFEELRKIRTEIFENSITSKTKELLGVEHVNDEK